MLQREPLGGTALQADVLVALKDLALGFSSVGSRERFRRCDFDIRIRAQRRTDTFPGSQPISHLAMGESLVDKRPPLDIEPIAQ